MATAHVLTHSFVTVDEYLHSIYEPDMDYVDGSLEDRNVGELDHGMVQRMVLMALARFEDDAPLVAIIETRTQTQPTRFRVPDVALVSTETTIDRIVPSAPLVCIEVLSPEDRLPRMRTKCEDYLRMGVPQVWIFDAPNQTAYRMTADEFTEVRDGLLLVEGTPVAVDVQSIYRAARERADRLR